MTTYTSNIYVHPTAHAVKFTFDGFKLFIDADGHVKLISSGRAKFLDLIELVKNA